MPVFGSSIVGTLTAKSWSARVFSGEFKVNEDKAVLPAIGIFVGVWLGLDLCLHVEKLGLVWQSEFFKQDGHLPRIGSLRGKRVSG